MVDRSVGGSESQDLDTVERTALANTDDFSTSTEGDEGEEVHIW
jgi:hypothetical protein